MISTHTWPSEAPIDMEQPADLYNITSFWEVDFKYETR